MTVRELCLHCCQMVQRLADGRFAHHYMTLPGIGIPCPSTVDGTPPVCPTCKREVEINVIDGTIKFHRNEGERSWSCSGSGKRAVVRS